jgi:uncharacterized protein
MKGKFRRVFFLLVFTCFLPCLGAQQLPRPSGFVSDFAGVMKSADIQAIESLAAAVKEKTGAELALVTVKTYSPYASIDEFSLALAESWGVGEHGKDNGVLLVLAMVEREVKIEVGYGLEGAIPDSAAGRILDTAVIPAFRKDNFSGGLAEGYRAIAAYVAKEKGVDLAGFDLPKTAEGPAPYGRPGIVFIIFFIGFFVLLIALSKRTRKGGRIYRPGSFGSGRSFNRSGGSFRGFGGGGFGGGGASRRF